MQARRGVTELAHWYNEDHRHSAIRFVTRRNAMRSAMRRCCKHALRVYEKARKNNRSAGQERLTTGPSSTPFTATQAVLKPRRQKPL